MFGMPNAKENKSYLKYLNFQYYATISLFLKKHLKYPFIEYFFFPFNHFTQYFLTLHSRSPLPAGILLLS